MGRPRVGFLVNGGPKSAMGERAASFAVRLARQFNIRLLFREGGTAGAIRRMISGVARFSPAVNYVFDMAAAGVAAAGLYKHATGSPFIVDTGDAIVELGRVLGRGPLGMAATRAVEIYSLRAAARVVVRGSYHRDLLRKRGVKTEFIPDGVEVDQFIPSRPRDPEGGPLVIGLVGSSVWIPSRQSGYGWELVEMIRLLKDRIPVLGVMIGDGTGIEILKQRCREYGISDRVEFAGRVSYNELPVWIGRFNICLSTQTDDKIGWVRTTGKLPLYMAAGRFVLASRVGEAVRVLPAEMLVEFRGSIDPDYPARLANRVAELVAQGTTFGHQPECVAMARKHFEYEQLAHRVGRILEDVISQGHRG